MPVANPGMTLRTAAIPPLLLLACTTPANAMLPPYVYADARRDAAYHVQVEVLRVSLPRTTPGTCRVEGRVVRVFRDRRGDLEPDTRLGFDVRCHRATDELPVGGTLWTRVDALQSARFMEAYLDGTPPDLASPRDQHRIIATPTATPVCPVDAGC